LPTPDVRSGPPGATLRPAEDFPRVWEHPSTDIRTRKRIVRLLIEEIVVTIVPVAREQIELIIHWKGGQHTQLVIPRNRPDSIGGRRIAPSSRSCATWPARSRTAISPAC
jgi:hypothetical protein